MYSLKAFIKIKFNFSLSFSLSLLGLRVEWAEENQKLGHVISVPPELYVQGCVKDVDEGLVVLFQYRLGFPHLDLLMVE